MNTPLQKAPGLSNSGQDDLLWQMAKRRAAFKYSAVVYLLVNSILVGMWYFTTGSSSYFWPIWPLLGWGLGLSFQYLAAYYGDKIFSAEKEYQKLKINKINNN